MRSAADERNANEKSYCHAIEFHCLISAQRRSAETLQVAKRKLQKRKRKSRTKIVLAKNRLRITRKVTDKLIRECVELVLEGLPIDAVCDYLTISKSAYYDWKEKGERFLDQSYTGRKVMYPEDEPCAVFVQAVIKAKATWQREILKRSFQDRNKSTWIRDMTMLERRDRANWGRNETVSVIDAPPLADDAYL